ncbi:unnamed protein product [Didymodactylos carnosus]|uniref:OTU domain-containing protein n=1 Tax=Didymodactylos carnosus TaxID=1234261 RepID=A0A814JN18_9BILA|nr:unnamed protein product [Didymodactylos carnosus]CAF1037792.1 unnamed protein product [Didymodactylos carnosus]CAF3762269.1 unnamed protein product [Didymodactylos carnosus]CAF3808273.1 unnamed protein product [Didymodactylos carnosus]
MTGSQLSSTGSDYTIGSLHTATDTYLEKLGLWRKRMPQDASSLFRAISESLFCTQVNHYDVRLQCIEYMQVFKNDFSEELSMNIMNYLSLLKDPNFCGGLLEVKALSRCFRINIIVYFNQATEPLCFNYDNAIQTVSLVLIGYQFDRVIKEEKRTQLAIAQAFTYKLLFSEVFKQPSIVQQAKSILRSSDTLYYGLETSKMKKNVRNQSRRCSEDIKLSIPVPYRTAKAFDPAIYRNVAFDICNQYVRGNKSPTTLFSQANMVEKHGVKMRLPCTDFYPTDAKRVLVTLINSAKGKDLLLAYYISQDTDHQTENMMHNVFVLKFGTIIKTSVLNTIDFPGFHFPINRYPKHMAFLELDRRSAFAQQAKACLKAVADYHHQKRRQQHVRTNQYGRPLTTQLFSFQVVPFQQQMNSSSNSSQNDEHQNITNTTSSSASSITATDQGLAKGSTTILQMPSYYTINSFQTALLPPSAPAEQQTLYRSRSLGAIDRYHISSPIQHQPHQVYHSQYLQPSTPTLDVLNENLFELDENLPDFNDDISFWYQRQQQPEQQVPTIHDQYHHKLSFPQEFEQQHNTQPSINFGNIGNTDPNMMTFPPPLPFLLSSPMNSIPHDHFFHNTPLPWQQPIFLPRSPPYQSPGETFLPPFIQQASLRPVHPPAQPNAKYSELSVNGVLLSEKSDLVLNFVDCIPLFHGVLSLSPMLEIALTQIEAYCSKHNQTISGYYQANENLNDSQPNFTAMKIMEKIKENNPDALLFMIDNRLTDLEENDRFYNVLSLVDKNWKDVSVTHTVNEEHGHVALSLVQRNFHRKLVDFDNHLDSISSDWFNNQIKEEIDRTI